MSRKEYQYCCVNAPDIDELNYIIDNSREITYETFRKNVETESFNEIKEGLGYTREVQRGCNLTLKNDWAVSFHKSKTEDNKQVYYICHSAIEYIFY